MPSPRLGNAACFLAKEMERKVHPVGTSAGLINAVFLDRHKKWSLRCQIVSHEPRVRRGIHPPNHNICLCVMNMLMLCLRLVGFNSASCTHVIPEAFLYKALKGKFFSVMVEWPEIALNWYCLERGPVGRHRPNETLPAQNGYLMRDSHVILTG